MPAKNEKYVIGLESRSHRPSAIHDLFSIHASPT